MVSMRRWVFLLACVFCAAAQTHPAASKWPIQSIAVEGNHVFPTAAILRVAGLEIGQVAGEAEFEAARERLLATGAFETVGYKFAPSPDGKGFRASFQVAETTSLYPVKFEDLVAPDADIEAALKARDPLFSMANFPATLATLARDAAWIEEYLAERGIRQKGAPIKVVGAVTNPGGGHGGKLSAVFAPLSELPSVSRISFEGNQVIAGSVLRMAIAQAGIGSLYSERHFREILDATVRPVYEARGRMRVTFPKIRTEEDKDVKGVHVIVTVDEGDVYTLSAVSVAQPTPLPETLLLKAANVKSDDIANFDAISEGRERMEKQVILAGYLDAKVTADRQFDDAKKTVGIVFRVDPGARYSMGKLNIKGLDAIAEPEMRRIWKLKPGDPFNPEYPDHFLDSVREQGMFDHLTKTKAETKIDSKAHTVDVTLTFTGEDAAGRSK